MRLLLDSQAFLYMARGPDALPSAAHAAIDDANNDLLISIVTPLELQIKVNTGKLVLVRSVRASR